MSARRSRALWGALPLVLLGVIFFGAAQLLKRQLQKRIDREPNIVVENLRVNLLWHVHLDQLAVYHARATFRCKDIVATPGLWANLRPSPDRPRLARVYAPSCTVRPSIYSAEETADADDQSATRSYQEQINALTNQLHHVLQNIGRLQVSRLSAATQIDGEVHSATLSGVLWKREAQTLNFNLKTEGRVETKDLETNITWEDERAQIHMVSPAPITIDGWRFSFESMEMRDPEGLRLSNFEIARDEDEAPLASFVDTRIALTKPPLISVEQGTVELRLREFAHLLDDSLFRSSENEKDEASASSPQSSDGKTPAENAEAASDTEDKEDVWSLRVLARIQRGVDELRTLSAMENTQWPAFFSVHGLDIQHHGRTLMHIEKAELLPDLPLTIDAQLSKARVSLRADSQPPKRWALNVYDASLRRLAAFMDLEEHLQGRTDARLQLRIEDHTLHVEGSFSVHQAILTHEKISDLPVGPIDIEGTVAAELSADRNAKTRVETKLQVNQIPIVFELSSYPVDTSARFQGSLGLQEPTQCQEIWMAIPNGLVPDLGHAAVEFRGTMQPRLTLDYVGGQFDTFNLRNEGFPGDCTVRALDAHWHPMALVRKDFRHHVTEGVTRDDIYVGPGTGDYVSIETLPVHVPAVMYLSEEIAFYDNHAVSMGLINRGIRHNLPRKRFAYGGSTVTQQLVKNLYFSRTKKLVRKFQEAIIAWAMTETLTKDQILELYINCIEFGPDLYGIVRASRYYFDKEPQHLSALEAAWLASLKPSPRRGERDFRRGYSDYNNWNSERIETLLQRVEHYTGAISEEDVRAASPYVVYFPTSPNAGARPLGLFTQEHTTTHQEDTQ